MEKTNKYIEEYKIDCALLLCVFMRGCVYILLRVHQNEIMVCTILIISSKF